MKNNTGYNAILAFLLIAVLSLGFVPQVNALLTSNIPEIEAGSIYQTPVVVENKLPFENTYKIKLTGNATEFATIAPNEIKLQPYESRETYLILSPNRKTEGKFHLSIEVSSDFSETEKEEYDINIINKNNLNAEIDWNSFEVKPCTKTKYTLKISNIGNYDDFFKIKVEGFDWEKYKEGIFIPANAQKTINIVVGMACSFTGWKEGKVHIEGSKHKTTIPIYMHVLDDYNFSIEYENQSACKNEELIIPITIKNNINKLIENSTRFNIKLPGKKWLEVSNDIDNFTVDKNRTFYLKVKYDNTGDLNIPVKVSAYGKEKSINLNIKVEDCYNINLGIEDKKICNNKVPVKITNRGTKNQTLFIKSNMRIVPIIKLLENETKTIYGTTNSSEINITLNNRVTNKSYTFHVEQIEDCHPLISQKRRITNFYENRIEKIPLKNSGIKKTTYKIRVTNVPRWIYLLNKSISLNPGETKNILLKITPKKDIGDVDREYVINATIKALAEGKTYNLPLTIIVRSPTVIEKTIMWFDNNKILGSFIWLIIFILLFLLIYACFRKRPKKEKEAEKKVKSKKEKRKKSIWWWILLIIIIIFLGVILFGYYKTHHQETTQETTTQKTTTTTMNIYSKPVEEVAILSANDENIMLDYIKNKGYNKTFIIWDMNKVKKFNIGEHFRDPDDDILYITSTKPLFVNVTIEGDTAIFTPSKDWHGVDEVIFKAEDAKGGQAISKPFYLIVKKRDYLKLIKENYWYIINAILLILIIIFWPRKK